MKKAKKPSPQLKKLSKNNAKAKKPTKALDKSKAMAPKTAKKAQTKAAPKAAKAAPAAKTPLKQVTAAISKLLSGSKTAPKKEKAAKAPKVEAAKAAKPAKVEKPAKAEKVAKGKAAAPGAVVAAVLTKPVKETRASKKAAAALALAEHNDRMCRESGCENVATTKGYCRLDYIKNWKKIKRKEMILKEGKLNQYIEELVSKYPDKYIDVIRQDLSTEVNFTKVIHDLELDESIDDLDYDGDSIDSLIGSIKKEGEGIGGDDEF